MARLHAESYENVVAVAQGEFENLNISSLPGRYVLIEKHNPPAVAFLVEHPALIQAFEQYEPTLF